MSPRVLFHCFPRLSVGGCSSVQLSQDEMGKSSIITASMRCCLKSSACSDIVPPACPLTSSWDVPEIAPRGCVQGDRCPKSWCSSWLHSEPLLDDQASHLISNREPRLLAEVSLAKENLNCPLEPRQRDTAPMEEEGKGAEQRFLHNRGTKIKPCLLWLCALQYSPAKWACSSFCSWGVSTLVGDAQV